MTDAEVKAIIDEANASTAEIEGIQTRLAAARRTGDWKAVTAVTDELLAALTRQQAISQKLSQAMKAVVSRMPRM